MTIRHTLSVLLVSGDVEYGLWCPLCRLPSAARVPLVLMGTGGVIPVSSVDLCLDCEAESFTDVTATPVTGSPGPPGIEER